MMRQGDSADGGANGAGATPGRDLTAKLSTPRTIALVARREFTTRVVSKAFLISNAVMLVVIVAAAVGIAVFTGGGSPPQVGLVGGAQNLATVLADTGESFGTEVETVEVESEQQARSEVSSGDLDVVLLPRASGGYLAVADSEIAGELAAVLQSAVGDRGLDQALDEQGVDREQLDAAVASSGVTFEILDPPDPEETERTVIAYVAVVVLFFQIFVSGLYVATGVIEEKSSRVVEVLLSTIRPIQLLAGKVIGIGIVGLLQLTAYCVTGVAAFMATGLITVTGTALAVLAMTLFWFVLGFVFFGMLYAAGGSMVSRQEDVNSTTTPINILAFSVFFAAQYSLGDPDGRFASILAWVPPYSASLMPLRVASGDATGLELVGSAVVMIVATAVLAWVAARIYERTILRSGTATTWSEVLRRR